VRLSTLTHKRGRRSAKSEEIRSQWQAAATFQEDDFVCKTAEDVKEAKELIESGFEYITKMDGLKLFRKRK